MDTQLQWVAIGESMRLLVRSNGVTAFSSDGQALLRVDFPVPGTIVRAFALVNTNLTSSAYVYAVAWRDFGSGPVALEQLDLYGPLQGYGQIVGVFSQDPPPRPVSLPKEELKRHLTASVFCNTLFAET